MMRQKSLYKKARILKFKHGAIEKAFLALAYLTHAMISRGLYIFTPFSVRFIIKSGLSWRAYGKYIFLPIYIFEISRFVV